MDVSQQWQKTKLANSTKAFTGDLSEMISQLGIKILPSDSEAQKFSKLVIYLMKSGLEFNQAMVLE